MQLDTLLGARHSLSLGEFGEAEALARQAPGAADAFHIIGLAHYRRGDLAAAEAALRQAIERERGVAAYHHDLGSVLQDRGELKAAIAAYRRALRLHPAFAEAWNDLGTARHAKGELEAAVECYRQAVRLRPDHAVAFANLGAVYRKLGRLADARRALQRELWLRLKRTLGAVLPARRFDPRDAGSLVREARRQLETGNARHAAEIAQRALELAPGTAAGFSVLSHAHLRQGRVAEALVAARRCGDPLQLARCLVAAGRSDEAVGVYERASNSAALSEFAELRLARGEFKAAEELLRRALARAPHDALLHAALGDARHRQGALDDAEAAYRRAIGLDPQLIAAHVRLSDVLRDTGRIDEALAAARLAVKIDDESPLGHFGLAMAYRVKGRLEQSFQAFERALELDPQRPQTLQQYALALREADRMEEAVQRMRAAVRLRPEDAALLSDLGVVLADTMQYDEAKECFRRALECAPASAATLQRQALLIDHLGDRAGGEALLRKAHELAPDDDHLHYNIGLHHLKYGNYAEGWDGYEYRRKFESFVGKYRSVPLPQWDGSSLAGKTVLMLPEQGLGDEIMFGSCVSEVIERAARVYLECDAKLEAIFRRSFARASVISRQRTLANDWVTRLAPRPEIQIAAGSLASHFRRSLADFPQTSFLKADPGHVAAWRARLARLGPGPKIGLSWRGGVGYTGKTRRSLSLEQLLPVLRLPGIHFVNLQYTDVREELQRFREKHSPVVHHWQEAIDDYDQTAALVSALDGVLTVCTAIVHLSGGLGQRALVMVPFGADWRYGGVGERMAWYPSVRLVRQQRVGDWSGVLEEVGRRLSTFS